MATNKKTSKKAASKSAKPAAKKAAGSRAAGAKKAVRKAAKKARAMSSAPQKIEVSISELTNLRNELKPIAQSPTNMTAAQVGALATRAHTVIETFLMNCGGGGGGSDQKIVIVPVGGN